MDLKSAKCIPCQVGAPILEGEELQKYLKEVPTWEIYDVDTKLRKDFEFENFSEALEFINKVGSLAQEQDHHPNLYLHDYKNVTVELWTHKINGLHQNDFIMATKIDHI